ncbi:hypothetical protein [Veillonella seminalis]|uniref:Uncharacterized protein n=1 Tax=Veillonella seminalis ACS-216-V-Col6b TaxID=883156 RepID=K9DHQ9_9FIRM|nr:hypothetical protein [Veillonella seminalis]EKU78322.1 hypothetical protein HMPREF9282_01228 [Veillonella seminalis ACS-216-V-Col6b]
MIRITSVKISSGYYTFQYAKETESGNTEYYALESKDKPRPELITAFLRLKELLLEKFNTLKFGAKFVTVFAVRIKYGGKNRNKDEMSEYKLSGRVDNKESTTCRLETQSIKIGLKKEELANEILQNLVIEGMLYIEGKRAQASLFEEQPERITEPDAEDDEFNEDFMAAADADSRQQGAIQ